MVLDCFATKKRVNTGLAAKPKRGTPGLHITASTPSLHSIQHLSVKLIPSHRLHPPCPPKPHQNSAPFTVVSSANCHRSQVPSQPYHQPFPSSQNQLFYLTLHPSKNASAHPSLLSPHHQQRASTQGCKKRSSSRSTSAPSACTSVFWSGIIPG